MKLSASVSYLKPTEKDSYWLSSLEVLVTSITGPNYVSKTFRTCDIIYFTSLLLLTGILS